MNDADIVTKVQTGGILRGHQTRLGYELSDSTGHKVFFQAEKAFAAQGAQTRENSCTFF